MSTGPSQAWPTFFDIQGQEWQSRGSLWTVSPNQEVTRRQQQKQNEGPRTTKQGTLTSLWGQGHGGLLGGQNLG